ncbi:MAG: hypothetical protein ACC628_08745 [Pirellulaceae bacterium]
MANRLYAFIGVLLFLGASNVLHYWTSRPDVVAGQYGKDSVKKDVSQTESFEYFRENVAPVLLKRCSDTDAEGNYVCHARPANQFAQIQKERGIRKGKTTHKAPGLRASTCTSRCHDQAGKLGFFFAVGEKGTIETDLQMVLAYRKACSRARFDGPAKFAKILRLALGAQAGGLGLYHQGGEIFESAADPDCQKLAHWVNLENENNRKEMFPISTAETFFRDEVLPVFARNTCMSPSCHVFNHSSFLLDPGMSSDDLTLPLEKRFTPEQVSFNRLTSKGFIQRIVYLSGDVEQSRILLKNIPVERGGVLHRGGNRQFFTGPEDPDYQTVKKWLELEREEAIAQVKIDGEPVDPKRVGQVQGILFVRTRTENHRHFLDIGKYLPGGDLYLLKLKPGETMETAEGPAINLTARFHPGMDADVREPDVRWDGRSILFAMRMGEQDQMNVYEVHLDESLDYVEGSFRRLTHGPATSNWIPVHYTDPTFVPEPNDENAADGGYNLDRADICFVANLAGEVVRSVERGTVGEADGGDKETIIDFDRPELDGSFVGRRIYIVDGTNQGSWRTITAFSNRLFGEEKKSILRVDRPFDQPIDNSSIYVIERPAATQPGFLPSYSVYGIKYPPPHKEKTYYDETLTRITWSPGQELDLSVRSTGELFFASQRSGCDKYGRPIFHVASCRRHLDTRFSFPTHQGNRSQVTIYADNYEMPSGIDIHVGLAPDNLWEAGNLNVSDHQFGPGLEARNPHDFVTGIFDENGVPRAERPDITNTRYLFKGREPSHTRFVFKKISLFPLRGPAAVSRTGYSPGGAFRDSVPLPDGGILVAHTPAPLDHLDPRANPDFDLYVLRGDPSFHPVGGKLFPRVKKVRLPGASVRGMSDIQAQPVFVRMKPKIHAGRRPKKEHLIRYPGREPDKRPATYLERNYLLIDAIMRDPSPVGKSVAYDRDPLTGQPTDPVDKVKYVRMVEVLPMSPDLAKAVDTSRIRNGDPESSLVSNGIHPMKRLVGEVPLASDGSIVARVPSNTPLIIQSLNADRMALRQEARYYFFAPNETFTISPSRSETFQTCAACMGAMDGNPKSLFGPINPFAGQGLVEALVQAGDTPPEMGLEPEQRMGIDFVRDIQPLLDRHCVACHKGKDAGAKLRLAGRKTTYFNQAYENLMQLEDPESGWYGRKRYVSERDALAIESYLIEKIYGRELKAPRELTGDAPHPSPALFREHGLEPAPLSDGDRMLMVRWIDMGATFRGAGTAPETQPQDLARATILEMIQDDGTSHAASHSQAPP